MENSKIRPHVALTYLSAFIALVLMVGGIGPSSLFSAGGDHLGSIESKSRQFVRSSLVATFRATQKSVWTAMQKQTSYKEAHADSFRIMNAIIDGDESELLELSQKYAKSADFLPAYFMNVSQAKLKTMTSYAASNGLQQAISRLVKDADDSGGWPYHAELLKEIEEKEEYRQEKAQEVWDSCPVSQDPDLYTNFPSTGPIARRSLTFLEDPSTAGPLVEVHDLQGDVLLDSFGEPCLMRQAYAEDIENANQCLFDKTKQQIRPRYCYRSAYMQAVVRSSIKKDPLHKCGKDEASNAFTKVERGLSWLGSALSGSGNGPASAPGYSNHQFGVAFDFDSHSDDQIGACLPSYWKELSGDPGHWDATQTKPPKDGSCTAVRLRNGAKRRFCFGTDPGASSPATGENLVRVTNAELRKHPDITKEAEKIIGERHGDETGTKIPFTVDGEEYLCVIEVHDPALRDSPGRFLRGKPVRKHHGCSIFKDAS